MLFLLYIVGVLYIIYFYSNFINNGFNLLIIVLICVFVIMGVVILINVINLINDNSIFKISLKKY